MTRRHIRRLSVAGYVMDLITQAQDYLKLMNLEGPWPNEEEEEAVEFALILLDSANDTLKPLANKAAIYAEEEEEED